MTDTITLTGLVATVPYVVDQNDKVPFFSFRLASNQRYFDRRTSQWVAADTNWYTVTAFRTLAVNAAASVHKGDRILVTGRLKIRRWDAGEKNGLSVDVEADSIGHDLVWGTARYERTTQRDASVPPDTQPAPDTQPGPVTQLATMSSSTDAGGLVPDATAQNLHDPAASPSGQDAWDVTTPGRQGDALVGASADSFETPF